MRAPFHIRVLATGASVVALTIQPAVAQTPSPATLYSKAIVATPVLETAAAGSCEGLASLTLPATTITATVQVAAGAFVPPAGPTAPFAALPAFCRVRGTIAPTSDSDIRFEVWLPVSRLERQVSRRRQWRLRRVDLLQRSGWRARSRVCDGFDRHGAQRRRRRLGTGTPGENRGLRASRHPRDDRESKARRQCLLWKRSEAFVLRQLLERGPAGPDGSAALPRRLRRHHRRRARERLHQHPHGLCLEHADDARRSGELHPRSQAQGHRNRRARGM